MPEKCPKCGRAMARIPAQVQIFGRVWIQRVASAYCAPCGVGQLTAAGREKLNRSIAMTRSVMGTGQESPKPVIQFEDQDGMIFQIELKSAKG
jgi:hypothetical protein